MISLLPFYEYDYSIEFGMGNWANGGKGIRKYPVSIIYYLINISFDFIFLKKKKKVNCLVFIV